MREIVSEPAISSTDYGNAAAVAADRRSRLALPALAFPRGSDGLLFVAVITLATVLLTALPVSFSVDSWLALVTGREVWQSGLPHYETLTAIAHGTRWVDQQWLSQLLSYGIYRLGGLGLLGVVNVAMMAAGVGGAIAYARRRGARASIVLGTLGLCLWQIVPFREVRTQAFAIPLIVAIVVLLTSDTRKPTTRVYWCLPLLVLLANLHGTASICAGLVSLRGITLAWERRAELRRGLGVTALWRSLRRPAALIFGAPLTLLLTPYGLENVSYYRSTLFNSSLQHSVTEWQPITTHASMGIPLFLLAGLVVWSFGRSSSQTSLWDKIALLALAAASIDVMRNALVFGLAVLVIMPASFEASFRRRKRKTAPLRPRLNNALCWAAVLALGVTTLATLLRPVSAFDRDQRPQLTGAVERTAAADPTLRVLADVRYADWLLWADPQLQGRVANDARWELLSGTQIERLQRVFSATGPDWKAGARGYRLLVLDRSASPDAVRGFLAEPGRRVLYNDSQRIVILRGATAAARS